MKILFVTPVKLGTGETITAFHMAQHLVASGHDVAFLASPLAARIVGPSFGSITTLGPTLAENERLLHAMVADGRPDIVVFADYSLLAFPGGTSPLMGPSGQVAGLDDLDAGLATLDHFGFSQQESGLFIGPAHLSFHFQTFPTPPARMHMLLPCPMHEPTEVAGRRGQPFRYWDVPLRATEGVRPAVRDRFLGQGDGLLVLHAVSGWASKGAESFRLPFYQFFPELLTQYLGAIGRPVTVVSVNHGSLLVGPPAGPVRFVNLPPIPPSEFEDLLFSCDLFLTENKVSISMGKAVCGLRPCALLKNSHRLLDLVDRADPPIRDLLWRMEDARPGSVYPYDVFPTGMIDTLNEIVLYQDSSLPAAFAEVEVYGGDASANRLHGLLSDEETRADLISHQHRYVERVRALPTGTERLAGLVPGAEDG